MVPQNKLANVVGERDLNIATGRLWQCNLNGDKLDFRVVNPVFSGDFIARILIVALNRVCNSSSSYWSNIMSSISNVLRISLGFSLTLSDVANSSRSITDLGNNILTDLFILNLFSFYSFLSANILGSWNTLLCHKNINLSLAVGSDCFESG